MSFRDCFARRTTAGPAGIGAAGERFAETFLKGQGLRILARNWRAPEDRRLEIDLVCEDLGVLVFVEVKTLSDAALSTGRSRLDSRKRRALRAAIQAYRSRLPGPVSWRLDLVEVYFSEDARRGECVHTINLKGAA
jgi:putative endonuclease